MEFLKRIGFIKGDDEEVPSKPQTQAQKTVSPSNLSNLSPATTITCGVKGFTITEQHSNRIVTIQK